MHVKRILMIDCECNDVYNDDDEIMLTTHSMDGNNDKCNSKKAGIK